MSDCVPAKFTRVSVAAGILTVTVPKAPVAGSMVSVPLVPLPIVKEPRVPEAPKVGVAVQLDAVPLVAFGTVPAAAEVAFVPPSAIVTVVEGTAVTVHDDPRVQVCPFTVVAELASPAFVKVPVNPSCTFPADGLAKVSVRPLVAALFSKLTVVEEDNPTPLAWKIVEPPLPDGVV